MHNNKLVLSQNKTVSYKYFILALSIHAIAAILRCIYVLFGPLSLHGDEAQYWTWSSHLSWSYYSKPPLIAFCNYITQSLFGHSELSVRINAILCGMLIGWVTYLFAYKVFHSQRKAFWASMLVFVMPFYFEISLIYSTDSILLLFWLLSSYFYWEAAETGKWYYWIALGFSIGIGSLGKYAMLFFIPILFVYLIIYDRKHLSNVGLYISLLIGLALFSPVVFWNINHQLVGLKHLGGLSGIDNMYHPLSWHFLNILNFVLGQILIMSPLFVVFYYKIFIHRNRDKVSSYFIVPIVFIWMLFFFISIIKTHEANVNWTMFVYTSLPLLLSSYIVDNHQEKMAKILFGITISLLSIVMTIPMWTSLISKKILPLDVDPVKKLSTWKGLSNKVDSIYNATANPQKTFIFTDDYMLTSELLFYLYPNKSIYFFNNGSRMCQYQLWEGIEQYENKGYDAIFVDCSSSGKDELPPPLSKNICDAFEHVDPCIKINCNYRGEPSFNLYIYKLKGFKSIKPVLTECY